MTPRSETLDIKWDLNRSFGVELEFITNGSSRDSIASAIRETGEEAYTSGYCHNYDNPTQWCVKTDSSCGYEAASRVMRGYRDLKKLGEVLASIQESGACFNNSCGMHIHVSAEGLSREQLNILCCYWVKIENFIMNGLPRHRRQNSQYCQMANQLLSSFLPDRQYPPSDVAERIRRTRGAISISSYPRTIEFRFGDMSWNVESVKNRVRFLVWFVHFCRVLPNPTNLNWYTPKQIMKLMGLWQPQTERFIKKRFSPAILSMRKWLLDEYQENRPEEHYAQDDIAVAAMLDEINTQESDGETVAPEDITF